ncbi:MAG: hypothetical protein KF758_03155 [Anaerolineales bacterium]|nr:hypothetical protein [Anaerolineales bacterium]MBX3035887.1 hypothetical protein [Anaerolineales bacterium]
MKECVAPDGLDNLVNQRKLHVEILFLSKVRRTPLFNEKPTARCKLTGQQPTVG